MAKREKVRLTRDGYLPNLITTIVGGMPMVLKVKPQKEGAGFQRHYHNCARGVEGECGECANADAGMEAGIAPFCISNDATFIGVDKFQKTKNYWYW